MMLNEWMIISAWAELIAELMNNYLAKKVSKWSPVITNVLQWSEMVLNWSEIGLKLS